ncbi:MAG: type II toxin-antitoxin system RelE/ParE family toxin [Treponema sp.]|nr:type II toxin-antitoxin system RelE/ParE family toxin [Treponema sp.]
MFTVEFSPKADKQVSKLEKTIRKAIIDYVDKMKTANNIKELYDLGGTELVGNLKGLWRFKNKAFRDYRLIAYMADNKIIITILAVEGRNESYKNKEELAKKARKGSLEKK